MIPLQRRPAPDDPGLQARIERACRGDVAAARELAKAILPRVRNLVRYFIRGDQDVDDVAQEALVRVFQGLPGYRGDGAFQSWADRIVARVAFAHVRARRSEQARVDPGALPEEVEDDRGDAPDGFALRRRVVEFLEQLSVEQREVLVLHHVAGLSVPEVARELSIPEETVRSRLRTGRTNLRNLIEPEASREEAV